MRFEFDWIFSPLAQYAAVAFGLLCSIAFFISTKLEISRLRAREREFRAEIREMASGVAVAPPDMPQPREEAPFAFTPRDELTLLIKLKGMQRQSTTALL